MARKLVEVDRRAAGFGDDGKQADARGGLQHLIARPNLRRGYGQGGQRRGRGELIQGDLVFRSAGMGRSQFGQMRENLRDLSRAIFDAADLRAQTAHLQHEGGFHGVVGIAPGPHAVRIGAVEADLHQAGDQPAIQHPRARQMRRQGTCGGEDVGGLVGRRGCSEQGGR